MNIIHAVYKKLCASNAKLGQTVGYMHAASALKGEENYVNPAATRHRHEHPSAANLAATKEVPHGIFLEILRCCNVTDGASLTGFLFQTKQHFSSWAIEVG